MLAPLSPIGLEPPGDLLVTIVDDDASMREALSELLISAGLKPMAFASTRELLESDALDSPGCLVLDVRMPGASGLDLQHHLVQIGKAKPIIFITGHGDIPMSVQAIKAGAIDFLTKPVRPQTFLDAVNRALATDALRRSEEEERIRAQECYEALTLRERQVLRGVVTGFLNKQIAFELGISEVTVKVHRTGMMRKMGATSVAQLLLRWQAVPPHIREERQ
nr:response regulator transcription factor [Devosia insulae]